VALSQGRAMPVAPRGLAPCGDGPCGDREGVSEGEVRLPTGKPCGRDRKGAEPALYYGGALSPQVLSARCGGWLHALGSHQ
jgi:hypothetical protein